MRRWFLGVFICADSKALFSLSNIFLKGILLYILFSMKALSFIRLPFWTDLFENSVFQYCPRTHLGMLLSPRLIRFLDSFVYLLPVTSTYNSPILYSRLSTVQRSSSLIFFLPIILFYRRCHAISSMNILPYITTSQHGFKIYICPIFPIYACNIDRFIDLITHINTCVLLLYFQHYSSILAYYCIALLYSCLV